MRRSRAAKAITHSKIVSIAAQRFREKGLNGIGVAELMNQAGTTAGGFYKHFKSRDALVVEALAEAFQDINQVQEHAKDISALLRQYLGKRHRDNPGTGCPIAALAGDIRHAGTAARTLFTKGLKHTLARYAAGLKGGNAQSRRSRAILLFSSALGGLSLARAVNDKELSQTILAALRNQLVALARQPPSRKAKPRRTKSRSGSTAL